jgi:hypothetical protein
LLGQIFRSGFGLGESGFPLRQPLAKNRGVRRLAKPPDIKKHGGSQRKKQPEKQAGPKRSHDGKSKVL